MAKMLVLDGDLTTARSARNLFGNICVMPEAPHITSLGHALDIVDEHQPNIILCGKNIDRHKPHAWLDVLGHVRTTIHGTKFVLWAPIINGSERRENAEHRYDAIVHRTEPDDLCSVVAHLMGTVHFKPESEAPLVQMPKMLVIDAKPGMASLGRNLFGNICDIPSIPRAMGLDAAKELVDGHMPAILLCGEGIEAGHPEADRELLDYAKGKRPGMKVILWYDDLVGGHGNGIRHLYNRVVKMSDTHLVFKFINHLIGQQDGRKEHH
jgi:hypothetical protein